MGQLYTMLVSKAEVRDCLVFLGPSLLSRESVCEPSDGARLLKGPVLFTGMRAIKSFLNRFAKVSSIASTIELGVHGGRVHPVILE